MDGLKLIKILICIILTLSYTLCAEAGMVETRNIELAWDYNPPPDLEGYDILCTTNEADAIHIPATDTHDEGNGTFTWRGDIKITPGKTLCYVQAVDLSGQTSGWSEPGVKDWPPSKVINITITAESPDVIVNVGTTGN